MSARRKPGPKAGNRELVTLLNAVEILGAIGGCRFWIDGEGPRWCCGVPAGGAPIVAEWGDTPALAAVAAVRAIVPDPFALGARCSCEAARAAVDEAQRRQVAAGLEPFADDVVDRHLARMRERCPACTRADGSPTP